MLDVLIDHRGKTPKKLGGDFQPTGVPVVSAVNLKSGRILLPADARCVSDAMYRRWMPVPLLAGDVLLTSEAPLGELARVPTDAPMVLGQRLFGLRGKEGVLDNGYLYYLLRWSPVRAQLTARATGTTVSGIRQSELIRVAIPVPDLDIQTAIAEILGALDDKIDVNGRLATIGESLALARLEQTNARTALSTFADLGREQVKPERFMNVEVDHFSLPAFDASRLPDRCSGETVRSNKFRLTGPTVLVSKLNPHIPRVWFAVPTEGVLALTSTEFVVLNPKANWSPALLWAACAAPSFVKSLASRVTGTTGSHQRVRPQDVMEASVVDLTALAIRRL